MNKFSVPGVYISEQKYTLNPLQIDSRCLAAFVGIAEKGPVGEPVLIESFDEYVRIFGGFDTEGVLPLSVYSYFKCGGKELIVTRVAHKESVQYSELQLPCQKGALRLQALTPGNWGNYISVRLWYEYEDVGLITSIDAEGNYLELENTSSLAKGDIIEINLGQGKLVCREVVKIEKNKVFFFPAPNIKKYHTKPELVNVKKVFYSVMISGKDKRNETYLHLTMNKNDERYIVKYINERSNLCRIYNEDAHGTVRQIYSEYASKGCDGVVDLTAADFIGYYNDVKDYAGLGTFESREDISVIACPDLSWLLQNPSKSIEERFLDYQAVQQVMLNQAERFLGRFAVLDIPDVLDPMEAISYARKMDSAYGAMYYPYINILDPLDNTGCKSIKISPSGAICGCISRTDNERGIFYAPANCIIHGGVGLSRKITEGELGELYDHNINVLKYFMGSGLKIWGAKTLSSDYDWRYINVRRTFSKISHAIKKGTQWAVFEVNDKYLRKRLIRQVSGFLLDLWMKGYLAGSTAEQGFYVRCDEELNPIENIDNGILTFEVGLAIVKPAEFFQITLTAEKDGSSVYIREE